MGRDAFKGFTKHQGALMSCQFCYFPRGDELIAFGTVKVSRTQQRLDLKSKMCKAHVEQIFGARHDWKTAPATYMNTSPRFSVAGTGVNTQINTKLIKI